MITFILLDIIKKYEILIPNKIKLALNKLSLIEPRIIHGGKIDMHIKSICGVQYLIIYANMEVINSKNSLFIIIIIIDFFYLFVFFSYIFIKR
jgi:hypothetical protein